MEYKKGALASELASNTLDDRQQAAHQHLPPNNSSKPVPPREMRLTMVLGNQARQRATMCMPTDNSKEPRWPKRSEFNGLAKHPVYTSIETINRNKLTTAFMIALTLLLGCTQRDSAQDHQRIEVATSSPKLRGLENLSGTTWPDIPMPPARVSITCSRLKDQLILSLDRSYLETLIDVCAPRPSSLDHIAGIRISYDGEIGPGMADLFARIHALAKEQPTINEAFWPFTLAINSPGGDALEAMLVGKIMSEQNWKVIIRGEDSDIINAKCYSACVLILAAATHRDPADAVRTSKELNAWLAVEWNSRRGARRNYRPPEINEDTSIGIHRLFIAGSDASSIAELQLDLDDVVQMVGDYLATHGVSRSLANDMMAIPSNDIRILTIDEVNRYGLGELNSAKADMERLELTRMCGADYVLRRADYLRRTKLCMQLIDGTESALADANHCINEAKVATDLPEHSCPDRIFSERAPNRPIINLLP